ncbi:MAG TPA: hypothetical protein VGF89_07745 [Steroidobacteraceae bacterium]|jgi:hypothetical protein
MRWGHLAAAACAVVATGCATVNHMALDKSTKSIDTSSKSVVLLTLDIYRRDKSHFSLQPFVVQFEKPGASSKADRQNFVLGKQDAVSSDDGHTLYLVRAALAPGRYRLMGVVGRSMVFPIIGTFEVPLLLDFDLAPGTVSYRGRVTAMLRPREENEFRAGPMIPLIDQAAAGLSTGTWEVTVEDLSDQDLPRFTTLYPVLASVTIAPAVLPPFDRQAAQRWWQGSSASEQGSTPATTASASK